MNFDEIFNQLFDTDKKDVFLPTGINSLDKFIHGGFLPELVILSGRHNHGKSTILLNLVANFSYFQQFKGMLIVPKTSSKPLIRRLLSIIEGADVEKLEDELVFERLMDLKKTLLSKVLVEYDPISIDDILSKAFQSKVSYLIIDDFQYLLEAYYFSNKFFVESLVKINKFIRDNGIPVFLSLPALASAEKRYGAQIPRLMDLYRSDLISNYANKIFLTYRAHSLGIEYDENGDESKEILELYLEKNSNGKKGHLVLKYDECGKIF